MDDGTTHPRLRRLEVFPREIDGRRLLCLRDPSGITDAVAAFPPPFGVFLLEMLDGTHDFAAIRSEFERRSGGAPLPPEDLAGIVAQLDEALFLDSPRFATAVREIEEEYRSAPSRPAALAGSAYPADAGELAAFLDAFYAGVAPPAPGARVRAVAVPHLDLGSGGRTAAHALAGLAEGFRGDTVVILGTGHQLGDRPFALTAKDFETPLGTVPVDRELFDRVVAKAGSWVTDEELVHRSEHSVEFGAVLLRHALGDRDFRILPVLCGSFHHLLDGDADPAADPMIGALLETIAEEAPDALLYASVDFAHMGPHYGDRAPLLPADLRAIETGDREMLDRLAARDAPGFFAHFRRDQDRRRVCGLSALYSLLALLPPGPPGIVAAYEQPVFPAPGNTVSIGAVVFPE